MKMLLYVSVVTCVLGLFSCEKKVEMSSSLPISNANISDAITTTKSVYAAGFENNGKNDVAKWWKDGHAISLTNGLHNAAANSIFVLAGNVYIAGYEHNGKHYVAKYWKNGQAINLTDGTKDAFATSIFVEGNDVYVAGNEYIGNHYVAKYWKNKIAVTLDWKDSWAHSIMVAGNNVYVAGSEFNGKHDEAKYWRNGHMVSVFGTLRAIAYGISLSNSILYVLGDGNNSQGDGLSKPEYLKNAQTVACNASPGDKYPHATGLYVSGSNVFAAGYQWNGHREIATYWKNGQPVVVGNTAIDNEMFSIFVSGSDICLAGNQYDGYNPYRITRAKVIKNGHETLLTDGSRNASANSVFVY